MTITTHASTTTNFATSPLQTIEQMFSTLAAADVPLTFPTARSALRPPPGARR